MTSNETETAFGRSLSSDINQAIDEAQVLADANECPCGVWERDAWYTACEIAPELIEPDPASLGWQLVAVVDPGTPEVEVLS